jgi:hypothetical protein
MRAGALDPLAAGTFHAALTCDFPGYEQPKWWMQRKTTSRTPDFFLGVDATASGSRTWWRRRAVVLPIS